MSDPSSSSSSSSRLTKKQRKAAEFKAAKSGSGSGSGGKTKAKASDRGSGKKRHRESTGGDVPEEDLLGVEGEDAGEGERMLESKAKGKGKGKEMSTSTVLEEKTKTKGKKMKGGDVDVDEVEDKRKKRKATSGEGASTDKDDRSKTMTAKSDAQAGPSTMDKSTKGKKISFDEEGQAEDEVVGISQSEKTASTAKGKRKAKAGGGGEEEGAKGRKFIVFVGNMSYKTTSEEISSHFQSHCSEAPTVRLLTTRSSASSSLSASKQKSIAKGKAQDTTIRSKGCAFLEFPSAAALQKALGLHHTLFAGRLINVELTAGGGGRGETRSKKIAEKNEKLDVERRALHEKYIGPGKEERKRKVEERRRSGEEVGPPRKKVRVAGEGEAQWGTRGAKGAPTGEARTAGVAGAKRQPRWMASGANAVRLTG